VIVLDTNVLSEPLRANPDGAVLSWIAGQDDLLVAIERTLAASPANVLPFDEAAARTYAQMQEWRRSAGVPLSVEDGMIAAICSSRSVALATRNTKDFEGLQLRLVDPWAARE
jgi:toxin FitB